MRINRSYIYRIYLTTKQKEKFEILYSKNLFLFNLLLEKFSSEYSNYFLKMNDIQLKEFIVKYKELDNGNSLSYASTYDLAKYIFNKNIIKNDSQKFLTKNYNIFPKKLHFVISFNDNIKVKNNRIIIPFIGSFKIKYHRELEKNININRIIIIERSENKFDLNISFSKEVKSIQIKPKNIVGFDYSSPHFIVDSNGHFGDKIKVHNFNEKKISKLKHKLSKCALNSNNYLKLRSKIENLYEQVTNKRNYVFHHFANKMVSHFDIIGVENLSLNVIARNKNLGKHTYENSYNKFLTYVKYKMEFNNKYFIMVPKYYPSTRICNNCGELHPKLSLKTRVFTCECGYKEDRDINAAINIKMKALSIYKNEILEPKSIGG